MNRPIKPSGRAAAKAPAAARTLHERLVTLSYHASRGVNQAASAGCLPALPILWVILSPFASIGFVTLLSGSAEGSLPAYMVVLFVVVLVLMFILSAWAYVYVLKLICHSIYKRYYVATWNELFTTNMMAMVVDEDYTQLLRERADDIWAIKWISPPPPKTVEQQLEYTACYHLAIRRMLRGVSRLDNTPLWQGGIAYYAGLRNGLACGCLLVFVLSWLAIPLWIIASVYYIQRCAALSAYCDYLLYDADAR